MTITDNLVPLLCDLDSLPVITTSGAATTTVPAGFAVTGAPIGGNPYLAGHVGRPDTYLTGQGCAADDLALYIDANPRYDLMFPVAPYFGDGDAPEIKAGDVITLTCKLAFFSGKSKDSVIQLRCGDVVDGKTGTDFGSSATWYDVTLSVTAAHDNDIFSALAGITASGVGSNKSYLVLRDINMTVEQTTDPDPDPGDGGEQPEPTDAAQRVADFLGAGDDAALIALAAESVSVITAMVRAYTRDNGFTGAQPNAELAAVITTASARLVANPEQLPTDVGTVATRGGFSGFSLAETFVLNRYRVRAR